MHCTARRARPRVDATLRNNFNSWPVPNTESQIDSQSILNYIGFILFYSQWRRMELCLNYSRLCGEFYTNACPWLAWMMGDPKLSQPEDAWVNPAARPGRTTSDCKPEWYGPKHDHLTWKSWQLLSSQLQVGLQDLRLSDSQYIVTAWAFPRAAPDRARPLAGHLRPCHNCYTTPTWTPSPYWKLQWLLCIGALHAMGRQEDSEVEQQARGGRRQRHPVVQVPWYQIR